MKKVHSLLLLFMLCFVLSASGATEQKLIINGETVNKVVASITFEGNNAVLTFSDKEKMTVDMSAVVLIFGESTPSGIYQLKQAVSNQLSFQGLSAGTPVVVYDAAGHIAMQSVVSDENGTLSVKGLKSGLYLLKANNRVVKFVKR